MKPWARKATRTMTSASAELARRRRIRGSLEELSRDLRADAGGPSQGGQFCVGSSGALSGRRADCVILDDIFRSMDDAYSESTRRGISDWFYGEVLPRLRPGGKVVGIGTRYHHQELFAELEASGRYKVIKLTAIAEEGDELGRPVGTYLWADQPDVYPFADFLSQQREVLPPRIWASQFMCKPSPIEGAILKASWLKTYHNPPSRDTMKTYIAVDFAVTESVKADFTAIVVFGLDPSSDIFVLQVWRRQADAATSVDALLDMVRDWKPLCRRHRGWWPEECDWTVPKRENEATPHLCADRDNTESPCEGDPSSIDSGAHGRAGIIFTGTGAVAERLRQ